MGDLPLGRIVALVPEFAVKDLSLGRTLMNFGGPEGPVSQIHSHLLIGAPETFSDLLRFVQMLKREWGAERNGKLPHLFIPRKPAT